MKFWLPVLAAGLVLAGCQSDDESFYNAPKALDKMSPEETCAFYTKYASNPELSPHNRALVQNQMRSRGCTAK